MSNNLIIGLGGHIDHGKTSLIKALNGFDGDKNPQEKQRGITLDISFSHLALPAKLGFEAKNISFIDVPGHEKLIKNMIAGSFGIDVFALLVSANEGIKPQTIEHLQVANALNIPLAICIITKVDLCPNQSELANLKKDIQALFAKNKNTSLQAIAEFSIYEESYKHSLIDLLYTLKKARRESGCFLRYYIDRSFSLNGIGCVTTGTILSGSVSKDESIFVCELQKEVQVKNITHHSMPIDEGKSGYRIALNLKGIESSRLKRGFLLSKKGHIRGFDEIDVVIYPFKDIALHNQEAQFFIGSKKTRVKISVLNPNASCELGILATLKSDEAIFSVFGERFILRNTQGIIGGGMVLNPITDPMKKKQKYIYCNFLLEKDFENAFLFCCNIHKKGFGLISSTQRFNLTHSEAINTAQKLSGVFLDTKNLVIYHPQTFEMIKNDILRTFERNKNALLSANSIGQKIKWASLEFIDEALKSLEKEKFIIKKDGLYLSKRNNIKSISEYLQEKLYESISSQEFTPLAPYNIYELLDIDTKAGDNALKALCVSKKIIRLQHNLFIAQNALLKLHNLMRSIIKENGYIDMAIIKNKLGLSRKYLIAYLDSLDAFDDIQNTEGKRTFKYKGNQ